MDLASFGPLAASLARAGLPALGTLLGAVLPPPFDLIPGPLFRGVAAVLGIDPETPDAPASMQAAVDADPATAAAKLQTLEQSHKDMADAANEELRLRLEDVQQARTVEVEYVKAGSFIQAVPGLWTIGIAVSFFSTLGVLIFRPVTMTDVVAGLVNILLGVLVGEFSRCGNFWMGSTQTGKLRGDQAIDFAHKAAAAPAAGKRK